MIYGSLEYIHNQYLDPDYFRPESRLPECSLCENRPEKSFEVSDTEGKTVRVCRDCALDLLLLQFQYIPFDEKEKGLVCARCAIVLDDYDSYKKDDKHYCDSCQYEIVHEWLEKNATDETWRYR
jgi:hypothetical protein